MTRDKRRTCVACPVTEISCLALARHRGRPCCPNCAHDPIEEETTS